MLRTSNPTLAAFESPQTIDTLSPAAERPGTMTIGGTVTATMILLGVLTCSAVGGWTLATSNPGLMMPLWIGAALAGIAIGFALRAKPQWAPVLGFVFAIVEGFFVGAVSLMFEKMVLTKASGATVAGTGIVFQAMLLTLGILGALLLAYRVGMIRVGGTLQRVVVAATGGIMFLYIAVFAWSLLAPLFGMGRNIPYIHELFKIQGAGMISIGFSVVVVVLASLNLVMDFQTIEEAAKEGQPKYMEWYGAFALLTTLVWLYLEVLRLLAKLRGRE